MRNGMSHWGQIRSPLEGSPPRRCGAGLGEAPGPEVALARARLAKDLVGLPQLAVLALERLQAFELVGRTPGLRPLSTSAVLTQLLSV